MFPYYVMIIFIKISSENKKENLRMHLNFFSFKLCYSLLNHCFQDSCN